MTKMFALSAAALIAAAGVATADQVDPRDVRAGLTNITDGEAGGRIDIRDAGIVRGGIAGTSPEDVSAGATRITDGEAFRGVRFGTTPLTNNTVGLSGNTRVGATDITDGES